MELDIHDPNYTEKLLTESKKYKSKSRPVGPVQSDAIYDDGKFRNCAWVTGKLNEQDAEIARLKGLCQDYHSEADSRDAEITKLLETVKKKTDLIVGQIELRQDADHEVIRLKQEVKDLEGKWGGEIVKVKIVKELKAQLATHQEFVKKVRLARNDMAKPNPAYKERFINSVQWDLRLFEESQALEDK